MVRPFASIRLRLALVTAVAVLGAGVAMGSVSYLRLARELRSSDEEFARHEAIELSQMVAPLRARADVVREVTARASSLLPEEGVDGLSVLDLDGRPVVALPDPPLADHERARAPWSEGLDLARRRHYPVEAVDGDRHLRAAVLVEYAGEPRWLVVSLIDTSKSQRALAELRDGALLGVPLAALAAFVAAYGLVALALRPVGSLVRDARMIAAEGPGRRLELPAPGSEVEELARLLNVMLQRTDESMGRVRRFAADASHELRTPLARILGEAEVALRQEGDQREALESIVAEVESMRTLVDGLLELSRTDTRTPGEGSFDVGALVEELAHEASVLGETRGIAVAFARRGGEALARGSRALVGRAMWNLLDNALKYLSPGGKVEVSLDADDPLRVVVRDDGPGIPRESWPRLFEPFFRADPARSAPGHGLGLPLSRSIARRHGGDLTHEPVDGAPGARFVLTLPRRSLDAGPRTSRG